MNPKQLLAVTVLLMTQSSLSGLLMAETLPFADVTITGNFNFKIIAKERDGLVSIEDLRIESGTLPRTSFGERWDFGSLDTANAHSTPSWDPNPPYGFNASAVFFYTGLIHDAGFGVFSHHLEMSGNPVGANRWGNAFPAEVDIKSSIVINGNLGQQLLKYKTDVGNITGIWVDGIPLWRFPGNPNDGFLINVTQNISFGVNFRDVLQPNTDQLGNSDFLRKVSFGSLHWSLGELPGKAPNRALPPTGLVISEAYTPDPNVLVFTCLEGLDEYFYEVREIDSLKTEASARSLTAQDIFGRAISFDVLDDGPGFAFLKFHELAEPLALIVSVGNQHFSWDGLAAFDFLAINPNGVESFSIMGDGFVNFDDLPVFSTKFAAGGAVNFKVAVPESQTMILSAVSFALFVSTLVTRSQRRFAS